MLKLVVVISSLLFATIANAEEAVVEKKENRFMYANYKDSYIITISNIPCPFDEIKAVYHFAAVSRRADGVPLAGCFRPYDDQNIEIYWTNNEKITILADDFDTIPLKFEVIQPPQNKIEM
jgi:hypothetical protein